MVDRGSCHLQNYNIMMQNGGFLIPVFYLGYSIKQVKKEAVFLQTASFYSGYTIYAIL